MSQHDHAPLKILAIGAHPDDCELKLGGTAALYRERGATVRFVSVTDGRSGHQTQFGDRLAATRAAEAQRSAAVLGLEYEILGFPDGALQPTLAARDAIIRLIRRFQPDLVITHRPNDYHPDHRYTSQLVCDAAYLLTVPGVAPDTPALAADPVILYMSDFFQRPYPFTPTVVVDITSAVDTVVQMLACHESQVFDWLPYNRGESASVPEAADQRLAWLRNWYLEIIRPLTELHRDLILQQYGPGPSEQIQYIEAFEMCEYGTRLSDDERQRLFPFLA